MAVAYGPKDNPYVEFPFDRITEVHWGGLAVEFGEGAGPPVDPPPAVRLTRRPKPG
jgi:hypothetical protein